MTIILRDYQQEAVNRTIAHVKKTLMPFVVEMSVGAGKSVYIAEVARQICAMTGKRVLALAPRAELVLQNRKRVQLLGSDASVYSASAGEKSLRHPIVIATPGTFISQAERMGDKFAAVIIDECEGMPPTVRRIIGDMKKGNPNLRVIGTTGTPFTTNNGYIYRIDENEKALSDYHTRDPYFERLIYRVTARQLLDRGYLTPITVGDTGSEHYEALSLAPNRMGRFNEEDVNRVFVGHGRKTANIVADAMARMEGRQSIVFFAATVRHAEEIHSSIPHISKVITGETANRGDILASFDRGEFRVLINVAVLTVGWDCPRVDGIVLMRATESARLFQQIIGRSMRLYDGKKDSLLLDYAQNVERHAPDGDIFNPEIKAAYKGTGMGEIECRCPTCSGINIFSARPNEDGYGVAEDGYFVDLMGERIGTENGPMPAHYGRRCQQSDIKGNRCDYYWTSKECGVCSHHNDIAARYCEGCNSELINPNEKLIIAHQAAKKDPTLMRTDEIISIYYIRGISRAGNDMVTANFTTTNGKFPIYLTETTARNKHYKQVIMENTDDFTQVPRTVTYRKEGDFYRVYGFNEPTEDEKLQERLNETNTV